MRKYFVIDKSDFWTVLDGLSGTHEVYVPVKKGTQRFYKRYKNISSEDEVVTGEVRPFEPLKAFFSAAREKVAEGFRAEPPVTHSKPFAIVGVKACDLKGFKVQDYVFKNDGCKDPFYIKNREENLIISADCTCAIDTCYCIALGIKPSPEGDFDLNLSEIETGFVVEVGSEKGRAIVEKNSSLFKEAQEKWMGVRDSKRDQVYAEVEANLKKFDVPRQDAFDKIIERNYESKMWDEEARTCVECGACNTICPTCHCFLLYDQKDEAKMARLRAWDSCMLKDFARVAGGANPRGKLWMRLRNRFEKKFDFFPKVAGVYACTGCGRCISACPAKIDIRKVLRRLVNNA